MIRILHTIDTTGPGGAETVFVHLATRLDPAQFTSMAAIRGPGWVCDALRQHGVEPLFVQSQGAFNVRYLMELVRIVRAYKIDVIQSHLLGSALYASIVGLLCRIPVISTIHGFVDTSDSERLMWLKRLLINLGSRKIVFVSNRLREHYVHHLGFSARKSVTIYNGVDTLVFNPKKDDSIRKELGIGPEHIVIGAVGNIRPAKGYDLFLKAARLVHDQHPECRFVVAGQGAGLLYQSLFQLRDDLGLQDVFFFIGFRPDAATVYNNFDIFVLPSTSEGFSLSTIEAIACGVQIVVTRSGGPEEIAEYFSGCEIVECNENGIANSLKMIIGKLKNNGKYCHYNMIRRMENFDLDSMIKYYHSIYRNL